MKISYFVAMVSKLDDSVGAIVVALSNKNMLQNSIIVFISDNGAPTTGPGNRNWGSNYPLRGSKDTLFEGKSNQKKLLSNSNNNNNRSLKRNI